MGIGPLWVSVSTMVLVLVAAKAHGRQLRLEREAHGHVQVDFRRRNDPWVERLWQRDRVLFWSLFAVLAAAALLLLFLPSVRTQTGGTRLGHLALRLAWSFAACFVVAGLLSAVHLVRDGSGDPRWRRKALAGSLGWWSLVAVAAGLTGALAQWA